VLGKLEPGVAKSVSASAIEQVCKALGQSLPPLLERFYSEIGSGWGPEYGILSPQASLELWRQWTGDKPPEYAAWNWPANQWPILDWGCQMYQCIDLSQPEAPLAQFRGDYFVPDEVDGGPGELTTSESFAALFRPEDVNLAEWITAWLDASQ
jgi:hypothetical protein